MVGRSNQFAVFTMTSCGEFTLIEINIFLEEANPVADL